MSKIKKLYYSIGEVSQICDIEAHVLRYWETIFDTLKPTKNRAGKRMYTEADIKVIMELKVLIKDEKYSTAGAKKALNTRDKSSQAPSKDPLPLDVSRDLREVKIFLESLLQRI
jgi:DNA-binding transcriptional MerR regulator